MQPRMRSFRRASSSDGPSRDAAQTAGHHCGLNPAAVTSSARTTTNMPPNRINGYRSSVWRMLALG